MTPAVAVRRDGGVGWVTLDRPESRNALSRAMRAELSAAFAELDDAREVRVIVLTGAGSAFCAGVDLKEGSTTPDSQAALEPVSAPLDRCETPVIAAVNGPALGGGCELALAADLRVASTEARFGLPEVRIGSLPGSGGTQRLTRAVAPALAARMIYTGEPIDAAEAHRIGLVSDLVAPDELSELVERLSRRIAQNAPLAVQAAKQSLRAAQESSLAEGLALERALWARLSTTTDRAEGRTAFRERRPPRFTGT